MITTAVDILCQIFGFLNGYPLKNPPIGVAPPPRGCGDDPLSTIEEISARDRASIGGCAANIYRTDRASSK